MDRESSSHIARRSCARDYEEFQNLTKLNTQGVMENCLCVLARYWLVHAATPYLSLGWPLLQPRALQVTPSVCESIDLGLKCLDFFAPLYESYIQLLIGKQQLPTQ